MIKGFFFDLDGTLVDTHQANYHAYKQAIAESGISIRFEDFKGTIGRQAKDFLPLLAPGLNEDEYGQIARRKAEYYKDTARFSKLNEPLLRFIESIKKGHVVALVTTAKRSNADVILRHHNIHELFDFVISADDVERSKPSPEGYRLALARAGLSPGEVIAFEDSDSGRMAAESAGIATIVVKDFQP